MKLDDKAIKKANAGFVAQRTGREWEHFFQRACAAQQIECLRIENGCRTVMGNRLIRVRQLFDFILRKGARHVFLDLKSIQGNAFNYSQLDHDQIRNLGRLHTSLSPAGYLIIFNHGETMSFFNYLRLLELKRGESLKPQDGIILGERGFPDFSLLFR